MSKIHFPDYRRMNNPLNASMLPPISLCGVSLRGPGRKTDNPNWVTCQRCDHILVLRACQRVMKEFSEEAANA